MADTHPYVELAKYPVAVAAVFLALVGAKFILEVPFGAVTKIGKDGVEFAQEAKGELASLGSQLNAATKAIEEIKKELSAKALSAEARGAIFEASQTVSNQTAQLATLRREVAAGTDEQTGYIWIGDISKSSSSWQRIKLLSPATNAPLATPPSSISPGATFTVSGNMVLRDGLPANDADYFQARKSLGVLPIGTKVRVLAKPVGIDREFAVQYWANVAIQR